MSDTQTQLAVVKTTLAKMEPEFRTVLPPQIPADKFVRIMTTAVQMNPDLLAADRRSLLAAGMKAAQDGLLLDGREAAAVVFNKRERNGEYVKTVQYMPMLGGLLKKLRNSGELATIAAYVVYENDVFEYELGDEERIVHKPLLRGKRGEPILAYAIAKTKDGAVYREVMTVDEVDKVRNVSRSKDKGPWVDWWEEMAKKSVIRRLCKRLPSSADVDAVLAADNETYDLSQMQSPSRQKAQALNESLKVESLPEPSQEEPVVEAEIVSNKAPEDLL